MKKLYFKEKILKILDHYPILNEEGREEYYLDQDFSFIGYKARVSDADGREVFRIDREIISILPKYTVSFRTGQTMTVQSKLSFLGKKVEVYLDGDLVKLEGDLINLNYQVQNSAGRLIGDLNKKFIALSDTYQLTIYDGEYEEELIALALCINNMNDMEKNAS